MALWVGTAAGMNFDDWSVSTNWLGASIPTLSDSVTIDSGNVTVSTAAFALDLALYNGQILDIAAGGSLTVANDLRVGTNAGDTLIVRNGANLNVGGRILIGEMIAGAIIGAGTGTAQRGTLVIGGATVASQAGTITGEIVLNDQFSKMVFNTTGTNGSGSLLFSSQISGFGRVEQNGLASTITLTGGNSYFGTTTISAGSLQIGDGGTTGSIGTGNVILGSSGTLKFNRSDAVMFSNVVSGQGGVVKSSSGTLTLTANNTYTGTTTIDEGALTVAHGFALGATANGTTVANLAALQLQGNVQVMSEALTINGNGMGGAGGALRNLSGNNGFDGSITLASDARINSDAGELGLSGVVSGAGVNLSFGGAGNITSTNVIQTIGGTITKDGSGLLVLTGANTFTGTMIVNSGIVLMLGATALGATTSGTIVNSGASLQLFGNNSVAAEALTLSGFGVSNSGALLNYSGTSSFGGAITLASATRINARAGTLTLSGPIGGIDQDLTLGGAGNLDISGVIGTGTGTLTKDGAGKVTLSGNNTYGGQTIVNAGTLVVLNSATLGSITNGTNVSDGATLQFESSGPSYVVSYETLILSGSGVNSEGALRNVGNNFSYGNMTMAGVGRINSDSGLLDIRGAVTHSGQSLNFGGAGNIRIMGGSVSSTSGMLTKDGSGTLTLSTNFSVFNGAATVNAGVLELYTYSNIVPISGGIAVNNAGTLSLRQGGTWTNTLTLNGQGSNNQGALYSDGTGTYAGTINLGSDAVIGSYEGLLTLSGSVGSQSKSLTFRSVGFNGHFKLSGTLDVLSAGIIKEGTGILEISSAQNFASSLRIKSGWVTVSHAAGLGSSLGATVVEAGGVLRLLGGISIASEALTISGTGDATPYGALRSSGNNVFGGAITLAGNSRIGAEPGLLTLSGGITGVGNLDIFLGTYLIGDMEISGAISTTGSLNVTGLGKLMLSGANTMSGGVSVDSGFLALIGNGTLLSSQILVKSGATFSIKDNFATIINVVSVSALGIGTGGDILIGGKTLNITDQASHAIKGNYVGSAGTEGLIINSSAATLDASALTFVDWSDGVDTITLSGNVLANTITGTSREDRINGGDGNDRLVGLGGNDVIEGGTGFDITAFSVGLADLSILRAADGRYMVGSSQGVDVLTGIERVEASNGAISLGGAELVDRRFGDYDGDGRADISFRSTTGDIAIWRMNNGAFDSVSVLQNVPNSWRLLGEGDFNGDGKDDLLWRNNDGQLVSWFMNDTTSYSAASGTLTVGAGNEWMVQDIGDYDGDGKDDILWRRDDGMIGTWIMNGLAPIAFGTPATVSSAWKVQGSGDTDGDSKDDVVWRNETTGQVVLWKMNGATFSSAGTGNVATVGLDWDIAAIADISGDGKADMIWRNNLTGAVHGWIMDGQAITSAGYIGGADLGWHIQGAGDFNGDGKADLMWARTDGTTAFWGLDGLTLTTATIGSGLGTAWLTS